MSAPPSAPRDGLQEAGTRPSRALPYQPNANASLVDGALLLAMSNDGAASVHLTVHAQDAAVPRRFDIAQYERAHETIAARDTYDVAIHGPNGFLRHFAGNAASPLEVHCAYDFSSAARLHLTITNSGNAERIVTIRPNAYDTSADRLVALGSGASSTQVWDIETSTDGWYDLTVSVADDFRWRFAGHVELGRASVSG
jgi:phospholipase C